MRDLLVQSAGILGIAAALVHGYLGETKLFASARIEPRRARLLLRGVWHCSVVAWLAMGVLLILVPTMGSEPARAAIMRAQPSMAPAQSATRGPRVDVISAGRCSRL